MVKADNPAENKLCLAFDRFCRRNRTSEKNLNYLEVKKSKIELCAHQLQKVTTTENYLHGRMIRHVQIEHLSGIEVDAG